MSTEVQLLHSHRAVKTPAAAGANWCYLMCGAGILVLPLLTGAHNSDVSSLLAFNMIFLGVASYTFHRDGDLLEDWSHRADLTFILVLVGALPFLAANGLWQAYSGTGPLPRDPIAMFTKGCAITLGGCVR